MTKVSISPSLLFQYAVKVLTLGDQDQKKSVWQLEERFAMPDFAKLHSDPKQTKQVDLRLAWSASGLYMQWQCHKSRVSPSSIAQPIFRFWLDTRGSIGNKRLTRFSHQFNHEMNLVDKTLKTFIVQNTAASSPNTTKPTTGEVQARIEVDKTNVKINSFFPKEILTGFQPLEFPQVSYFFDVISGGTAVLNAGTDSRIRYDQDPSVWIRGTLV